MASCAPLRRLTLHLPSQCTHLGAEFGVVLAAFPGLQVCIATVRDGGVGGLGRAGSAGQGRLLLEARGCSHFAVHDGCGAALGRPPWTRATG